MDFGPKNCIFGPKFCIFLRYTYETPIFLGQTHRTGLITCPPYPEVTLDTFGFPVDGRLAVWPLGGLFLGPDCPKWPFLGPKVGFLARNQFFVHILQFFRYHHDQTLKRQRFCVAHVAERAPGGLQEPIFGPKIARKSDFFTLHL